MTANPGIAMSASPASHVLGRKLDTIPFSPYHVVLVVVLGFVGFIEGYDLALSGSLLVLARVPLHLSPEEIRWLAVAPTFVVVLGGFAGAGMSDRVSPDRHADWRDYQHIIHSANPAGAKFRATADPAPYYRHRVGLDDFGAVSDRRRADAGA